MINWKMLNWNSNKAYALRKLTDNIAAFVAQSGHKADRGFLLCWTDSEYHFYQVKTFRNEIHTLGCMGDLESGSSPLMTSRFEPETTANVIQTQTGKKIQEMPKEGQVCVVTDSTKARFVRVATGKLIDGKPSFFRSGALTESDSAGEDIAYEDWRPI